MRSSGYPAPPAPLDDLPKVPPGPAGARRPSGDLWKVAHINTLTVCADDIARFEELIRWVRSLGVDVDKVTPRLTVTQDGADRSYWLHLSEFVFDAGGHKVLDHAERDFYTRPLVIPIIDFPAWLPEASQQQGDS